jgi:DNA-directed RNA polymerase subunit M/transcription elongation factor TFIIS
MCSVLNLTPQMHTHTGTAKFVTPTVSTIVNTPASVNVSSTLISSLGSITIPLIDTPITAEDYEKIMTLKWGDGVDVFRDDSRYLAYEIFTMLIYPRVLASREDEDDETTYQTFDEILETLREIFLARNSADFSGSKSILELPVYVKERISYLKENRRLKSRVDVVSGIHQCRYCHSYSTKTIILQMAGGDEADTHKTHCNACGKDWSEH